MATDDIAPNATTRMHQCSLHLMSRGQHLQALQAFQACKDDGHVPPGKMFVSLINLQLRLRRPELAQELLDDMKKHHSVSKSLESKVRDAQTAE